MLYLTCITHSSSLSASGQAMTSNRRSEHLLGMTWLSWMAASEGASAKTAANPLNNGRVSNDESRLIYVHSNILVQVEVRVTIHMRQVQ